MYLAGEGIDPPFGALVEMVRDIQARKATVYTAADRIRGWRI